MRLLEHVSRGRLSRARGLHLGLGTSNCCCELRDTAFRFVSATLGGNGDLVRLAKMRRKPRRLLTSRSSHSDQLAVQVVARRLQLAALRLLRRRLSR
jgi:hypothetical protein